ncbi:MAG: hypothetical protein AB7V42_06420 [Thermoleophilia bacterium]
MDMRRPGPFPAFASARTERVRRERDVARLRRQRALEAEVAEQLEPRLGPAGRPVGDAAMALWRRTQVDAYLAMAPWRRAWRTWRAWGPLRRAVTLLPAACAWTVLCLPLRMVGVVDLAVSQAGCLALAAAAPIAAFVPPGRRRRFEAELPPPGPPWRASPAARRWRAALAAAAAAIAVALGLLAALGPGPGDPASGTLFAPDARADRVVVRNTVALACGRPVEVRVRPLGDRRYLATVAGGGRAIVEVVFSGRSPVGAGSGHGQIVGRPPSC